jgi:transcriptional regulator with XRE-family HTH domain
MESTNTKEKFIELRAQGYSFDKIAKELGKAKQTLVDWSRELQEEIANRKALELEALYEKFYLLKEHRLKTFGATLSKLQKEIESRNLSDVPTDKLLDLQLKYLTFIRDEYTEPQFRSSQEIAEERIDKQIIEELTAPPIERKLKAA